MTRTVPAAARWVALAWGCSWLEKRERSYKDLRDYMAVVKKKELPDYMATVTGAT